MAEDLTGGDQPDETKAVTLRTFNSRDAADLAAAKLEAHGIECWIQADDCGGMYPNLTLARGVKLLVRESEVAAAVTLLDTPLSTSELAELEANAISTNPPQRSPFKFSAAQFFAGLVIGILLTILFTGTNHHETKTYYSYTSDGKAYEAWIYSNGHLVELLTDRNLDGHWDHWTYYEHGHVARAETDNNFDGKVDEWITYTNGCAATLAKDQDFNGIPDEFFTYNSGVLEKMEIRPNNSKFPTQRWICKDGIVSEVQRGGDSNGNFREIVRYDAFFEPISTNTGDFKLLSR